MFELVNILATNVTCPAVPSEIMKILSTLMNLIKIGIPIILVILGMLDMGKAVMSQKEDEIKKAQSLFIKRIIYAVVVFLIFPIVELVVTIIEGNSNNTLWSCVKGILTNNLTGQ